MNGTDPNTREALVRRRDAGTLTWRGPALMLFARAFFAVVAQALVAVVFAVQSSPTPWRDAAAWLPVYGTLIDAGCLALLWQLMRREGLGPLDLLGFERSRLGRDVLFGLGNQGSGTYVIIDAKTGKLVWKGEPRAAANAAFVRAGNYLLVLEADGELLIADATNKTAFTPIKRYKVADADTWPAPALSGNRIFVKDVSSLTLWTFD